MDEQQFQELLSRVIEAVQDLKPHEAQAWQVWGAFGSYATLAAAVVAFFIGWWTIKQKREADARAEWWRRTQWALEATASANDVLNSYGAGMLDLLARSELADVKDKELLDAVWEVTDTGMQDDNIEELLKEAANLGGLDKEEEGVVRSFYIMDGHPVAGDNGAKIEREGADGPAEV